MQTLYNLESVENVIAKFTEVGGQITTVREGTLGYGLTICHGENLKTAIITEVPINCWNSGHTIRMYNRMPEKYRKILNDFYDNMEDDLQ